MALRRGNGENRGGTGRRVAEVGLHSVHYDQDDRQVDRLPVRHVARRTGLAGVRLPASAAQAAHRAAALS